MTGPDRSPERLLVFLRRPEPGRVKTRLAATVGQQAASDLYGRMSRRVLGTVAGWDRPGVRRVAVVSPPDALEGIERTLPPGMEAEAQSPGDLGTRMEAAFARAFGGGASRVAAIGTDCVDVTGDLLDLAFEALRDRDAVLGPARDGGYWLLGLARPLPGVFRGIPWGTDGVLAATRERLREVRVEPALLPVLRDLDTEEDLRALGWL